MEFVHYLILAGVGAVVLATIFTPAKRISEPAKVDNPISGFVDFVNARAKEKANAKFLDELIDGQVDEKKDEIKAGCQKLFAAKTEKKPP